MKFRLIIDKDKEEELVATVHRRYPVIDKIEALVTGTGSDSIAAYLDDEIRLLAFDEVDCITVIGGKTFAVGSNGRKYLLKKRLYEIEETLPPEFIRINKSSIANGNRILRFKTTISGGVDAEFKCGYTEYVSRRCFAELKRRFGL